jgi:hypothetical protein
LKRNSFIIICLAFLLGACGPQATPTIDPVQVQASSVAMASTMIAETQAAIPPTLTPTGTPLPSPTPLPTSTETPAPTAAVEASPTDVPAVAGGGDPCNGPFLTHPGASDAGKSTKGASVYITNTTRASVTVALYLAKNAFGQCGYVSYVLAPNKSVSVINVLPYGCYTASAYINDPKKPSYSTGGPACITGPDRTTFTVYADRIKITGP